MLLAIDTGNTNTLFAIHDMEGSWVFEWRIATNSTRTADEYAVWFHQLLDMANLKFSDITACVLIRGPPIHFQPAQFSPSPSKGGSDYNRRRGREYWDWCAC